MWCKTRAVWAFVTLQALAVSSSWTVSLRAQSVPPRAQAGDALLVEGRVLELENGELVVDLAANKGAAVGDVVQIWRPLKLRHPITGKLVVDRFLIGTLRLTQVRPELALAKPEGKLTRAAQRADVVLLLKAKPKEAETPYSEAVNDGASARAGATTHEEPAPPGLSSADPDAQKVTALLEALRGTDVPTRIRSYESYVKAEPESRFAPVLHEEAMNLRQLMTLQEKGVGSVPELRNFEAPDVALAGVAIELVVELKGPVSGAVFHSRNEGEVSYVPRPMTTAGNGYYVVKVPAERLRAPRLHYFIEATDMAGEAREIVGSASSAKSVVVHEIPRATARLLHETTASVVTDYADWNRLRGNDYAWQTEGYIGMRFADLGVRAARTGFGVYRGRGGSLEELDQLQLDGRRVGLTYGYLEGEFGFSPTASLIVRAALGLREEGVTAGAQALVRIGSDKKTNLTLGGEVLGGVGVRSITQLELAVFERFPVLLRTEVTNQPAGSDGSVRQQGPNTSSAAGDIGARAIAQVGYRILPELVLALRGSYQGRTINHAGPGLGGAVTYTW